MDTQKDKITYKLSYFTNFRNEVIPITVCALSQYIDSSTRKFTANWGDDMGSYQLYRQVSIGIAVYNIEDTWNFEEACNIALNKARQNKPVIFTADNGVLNDDIISDLITTYIYKFREHPEKYIKGYLEAAERYNKSRERIKFIGSLNVQGLKDREVISRLKRNGELDKYIASV